MAAYYSGFCGVRPRSSEAAGAVVIASHAGEGIIIVGAPRLLRRSLAVARAAGALFFLLVLLVLFPQLLELVFLLGSQDGEHLLVRLFAHALHLFFFLVVGERAVLVDGHALLPHLLADLLELLLLLVR